MYHFHGTYKFSASLLKNLATIWKRLNMLHEYIMAMTNAAVEHINLNNYGEAKLILTEALSISIDIENFGHVYI